MGLFDRLAEARIREWQRERSPPQAAPPPDLRRSEEPLEVELLKRILEWRARARETQDPNEKSSLLKRAAAAQTQLLVLLETTGRPLAAQRIARELDQRTGG